LEFLFLIAVRGTTNVFTIDFRSLMTCLCSFNLEVMFQLGSGGKNAY